MAENLQRSRGRDARYKFDRGGMPTEFGPFIGIVVNNIDNTRAGRLQVWIAEFGATNTDGTPNLTDETLWRTVSYCPPFYGATPVSGTSTGTGTYPGNQNSYGMWFTPPDLGTRVLCFFVSGDPSQGYYVGCIPEQGINHMIPAIGSASNYVTGNKTQAQYFSNTPILPVTEINTQNSKINENPRFFDQPKPVQSVLAAEFFQQGLDKDPIRGPIASSSQRESPSNCYGISTPGRAIYQGGYNETDIKAKLSKGQIKAQDIKVIGRRGGHTFVMDDGDLVGHDALIRIRTAKGHQITMSDDGDSFYITHANGQTWIELGKQGTVDVFSTNSVNVRTQGSINLQADVDININAGNNIKMKAKNLFALESAKNLTINADIKLALYSKTEVNMNSAGNLALKSKQSSWNGGTSLNFKATQINLNGAPTLPVSSVPNLPTYKLPGTTFNATSGWTVQPGEIDTIVTRAPTHEPYPYHNKGVNNKVDLNPVNLTTDTANYETTGSTQTADQSKKSDEAVAKVQASAVQNPVKAADVATEPPSTSSVGSVSPEQVQGMTAQAKVAATANRVKVVGSPYDDNGVLNLGWELNENNDPVYTGPDLYVTGVGEYGQSPGALVQTGYLKPGTLSLMNSPLMVSTVLNSPSSWTGQFGVTSLLGYLNYPVLQNLTQIALMSNAYTGLINQGVLNGNESPEYQATFIQPATAYGVDSVASWVNNTLDDTNLVTNIIVAGRQGEYAINFIDTYGKELGLVQELPGYSNTVDRQVIDQTMVNIIGNDKIPTITYADANVSGIQANVVPPDEDSTFRFAPGQPKG